MGVSPSLGVVQSSENRDQNSRGTCLWYPLVRSASLAVKSADQGEFKDGRAELKRISARYEAPPSAVATVAALEGEVLRGKTARARATRSAWRAVLTRPPRVLRSSDFF